VQVGECRPDEEIMNDLGRRLNLPGAEQSLEDILNYRLQPLGISFEELKKKSVIFPPHEYYKFEKKGFATPSRKVELYSKSLERLGYDPLPTFREPPESPKEQPELAKQFPYILTTGSRRLEFFHSEHRQIESLRRRRPHPIAEIHPATAEQHGITAGDWIYVSSPRGRIRMKAEVTKDIREGMVSIDHGWWFPEREGPDFGVWESNANLLTSNAPPYDPAFGSYQLKGLLCSVEKIEAAG
jgi:thiosulfate reductase/polysulfide reductase chain A